MLSPCVCFLLCVVCSHGQEQSAQGQDEEDGEDFAGDCQRVFHNKANVMCCVLSVKIKMHGGANFFSGPLLAALGFVGSQGLRNARMCQLDRGQRRRSFNVGGFPPARCLIAVQPPGEGGAINVRRNPAQCACGCPCAVSRFLCDPSVDRHTTDGTG